MIMTIIIMYLCVYKLHDVLCDMNVVVSHKVRLVQLYHVSLLVSLLMSDNEATVYERVLVNNMQCMTGPHCS